MIGRVLRALPTIQRIAIAGVVAYRAEMIIWVLTSTLPLVMLALWNAASASGPLGGLTQTDFGRYFAATLVVRQLTGAWIVWELNYAIRKGDLSPKLLKPVHPLVFSLCETAAALPFRIIVLAPILVALAWWRPDIVFWPGLDTALAFAFSIFLAFLVVYLVQCCFGMLAFWFDQSMGFFSAWFVMWSILSGYVVPMPLLPEGVAVVARWLPFHASLGAAVDVAMGLSTPAAALGGQLAWVAILGVLAVAMWRTGIARYGAVGA